MLRLTGQARIRRTLINVPSGDELLEATGELTFSRLRADGELLKLTGRARIRQPLVEVQAEVNC